MTSSTLGPIGASSMYETVCRPGPAPEGAFSRVISQYLGEANAQQAAVDQSVLDLATGRTDEIHQVLLGVAKADLTFRTILEVRNRLTEAYQEVMRMQF